MLRTGSPIAVQKLTDAGVLDLQIALILDEPLAMGRDIGDHETRAEDEGDFCNMGETSALLSGMDYI
jgi:hypothetical protein